MPSFDAAGQSFVHHPNGQTTHYFLDDFTDPWKPSEVILLQHGYCRTATHWYHWVPPLARKYRIIRRDLRGHGLSSSPDMSAAAKQPYDYSLDTLLEEIIDLLDQLGIEKVHFVGESTSGMIGMALAAKHPQRLHSLVLCSSPTYLPQRALETFAFGHPDWPTAARTLGSRGWGETLSKLPGTVSSPDPDYVRWWIDQVAVSSGEGLAGYAAFLSKFDARPFIGAIKVPSLILAPKHSAVIKVSDMEELSRQIEGCRLQVIDKPGHEIFTSAPDECQAAALKFWHSLET
ncbi:3-oxoadipate enol-lactonase [Seiridium cupressi]